MLPLEASGGLGGLPSVLAPGPDESLRLDAQRIGDPIDVVEEADNLCSVVNGNIIQTGRPQARNIGFAHLGWRERQFLGVGAQGAIDIVQRCRPPIARDRLDERVSRFIIGETFDLSPEVMRMRADSVDAVVGFADHDGEHLALRPRQRRLGEHGRAVHFHGRLHHAPVQRHDLHDVPNASGAGDRFFQFFLEQAGGLVDGDLFDVGHGQLPR